MTFREGFEAEFGKLPPARIALEAGTHSPWASRLLCEAGHEVLVANPRRLRIIFESGKKNDKLDARNLARVARLDRELLSPIQHRGAQAQADLEMIRARHTLVNTRTQLINHVRGAVKSIGGRLPASSAGAFPKLGRHVPKELWTAVSPILDTIASLTQRIRAYDKQLEELSRGALPGDEASAPSEGRRSHYGSCLRADDR